MKKSRLITKTKLRKITKPYYAYYRRLVKYYRKHNQSLEFKLGLIALILGSFVIIGNANPPISVQTKAENQLWVSYENDGLTKFVKEVKNYFQSFLIPAELPVPKLAADTGKVAGETVSAIPDLKPQTSVVPESGSRVATQIIREIHNYTVRAMLTESELTSLILKSETLKQLLKGDKGDPGLAGVQGPPGYSIGSTPPGVSNPGTIGGITYHSAKEFTSNTLTVTGTSTLANVQITGDLDVTGTVTGIDSSQWTTTGSHIYYDDGNVGVGDTSPASMFTVGSGDLFQIDSSGRVFAPNGASGAGLLAYSFVNDTNTGFYRSAADEIRFQTAGSDRVTIDASGNVGIGTATPDGKLNIEGAASGTNYYQAHIEAATGSATNVYGLLIDDQTVGTNNWNIYSGTPYASLAASSQTYAGQGANAFFSQNRGATKRHALVIGNEDNTTNQIRGFAGFINSKNTSSTRDYGIAFSGDAFHTGAGTVTTLVGGYFYAEASAGTATSAFSLYAEGNGATGGAITNNYGLFVESPYTSGAGSITNAYGIFLNEQVTGTNKWNIYSDGATSRNFFAGTVGIGDTTPDYSLELYEATSTPVFALSDDDIAHGVTTIAETDVFGHLSSISTTVGGAYLQGLADASGIALQMRGVQSSDPTDTVPAVSIIGAKASGTGVVDLAAAETIFQVANNDDTSALSILGDGKVGIGIDVPTAKLQISTTAATTALKLRAASGQSAHLLDFVDSDGATLLAFTYRGYLTNLTMGGDLNMNDAHVSSARTVSSGLTTGFRFSKNSLSYVNGGNLGVGDDTPDALLDVKGTVCLDLNADEACTDNTSALSDARLKTNVTDIINNLELVKQLRPVRFTWNGEYNTGTSDSLGFLAQEVEVIFPELVITDTAGYKNLDYSKLTGVLAGAVQELDLKIEELTVALNASGQLVSVDEFQVSSISSVSGNWSIDEDGNILAKTLTVEEGISMKDQVTGEYYCVTIENGEFVKTLGECGEEEIVSSGSDSSAPPQDEGGEVAGENTEEPIVEEEPEPEEEGVVPEEEVIPPQPEPVTEPAPAPEVSEAPVEE
jgi:hypothetical protein